jgi:aminoglycoside phosphotransferase family enzyme/predicted kinase
MSSEQRRLIDSLQSPNAFPHATTDIRVIETHISWVILTGEYAYKIKKAVQLPFVDFSTLARRQRFCDDELRLNSRLAPEIYLAVVPIGGSYSQAKIGVSPAIEVAVQMRQFPADATADRLIAQDRLVGDDLRRLAQRMASFHAALEPQADPDGDAGIVENLTELESVLPTNSASTLREISGPLRAAILELEPIREARVRDGRIRECHGDLHLANLAWIESDLVPFDCLEFDHDLRTIDVIDEIAFLYMDLSAHARRDLAFEFLNGYLEHSGDYAGLRLLHLYAAHRALVRAKVEAIGHRASSLGAAHPDADAYLDCARAELRPRKPCLVITNGLSGSGKSTLARRLAAAYGAVHVRSDVERKRLHGLAATDRTRQAVGQKLYSTAASDATYGRLRSIAESALRGGIPVIVDAAFLSAVRRAQFAELARQLRAEYLILACHAPIPILRDRIRKRLETRLDPSDADEAVLDHQLATAEPFTAAEELLAITADTSADVDIEALSQEIRAHGQVSLSSTSY